MGVQLLEQFLGSGLLAVPLVLAHGLGLLLTHPHHKLVALTPPEGDQLGLDAGVAKAKVPGEAGDEDVVW